jgi:hypothetical protein
MALIAIDARDHADRAEHETDYEDEEKQYAHGLRMDS